MLNCLKQNRGFILLILVFLIVLLLILFAPKKSIEGIIGIIVFCLVIIFCLGGFIYNMKECNKKNKQDELAVIKDLNNITIPNIINGIKVYNDNLKDTPVIANWTILNITDNGNNIIKLKTLQEHLYNRKKDLLIDINPNINEIAEVDIYINEVNPLIARYNLKHQWFTWFT
jgi:hypothetical protein